MTLNELLNNLLFALLTVAIPFVLKEFVLYIKELIKSQSIINDNSILSSALEDVMDAVLYVNQIYVDALKREGTFTEQAQNDALKLAYNEALKAISQEAKEVISKTKGSVDEWLYKQIEIAVNNAKKIILMGD